MRLTEVSVKDGYKATCNHYRKLVYPLFLILLVLLLTPPVQAKYSGGSGEPNNPYQIADANDMNEIGLHDEDWDKHFVMVNDINLADYTGTEFNIIGDYDGTCFSGVFDGNGHTISNFIYSSTEIDNIGLFGYLDDPNAAATPFGTEITTEIKDLGLINPNVDAGTGRKVGSLVGWLRIGALSACYVQGGNISGDYHVGGLAGTCGSDFFLDPGGQIINCFATSNVKGSDSLGGLVGFNLAGIYSTIDKCYATGAVSGDNVVGGLVGTNNGPISNCYAMGSVLGGGDYGGVGGLVGDSIRGNISNCYSTGTVKGDDFVGGLIGVLSNDTVSNCYSAGVIDGNDNTGGLVGGHYGGSYAKCFWDSDINPDVNGIANLNDPNVIGESTANMQTKSTFTNAGWDFNTPIWKICDGTNYPKLAWQIPLPGDFVCPDGVEINDLAALCEHWLLQKLSADVVPDGGDGIVNFFDYADFSITWQGTSEDMAELAIFAEQWLQLGVTLAEITPFDISPPPDGDGIVNFLDFAEFADYWLAGVE